MSLSPEISVIIPVFNSEAFIRRCIDSILNQTYKNIEIILLDDGSGDGSADILREYQNRYPDLIRTDIHENLGIAGNRNLGIKLARGKYLVFVDADDYIDSDYCETFYREITAGDFDFVCGGFRRPNSTGKITRKVTLPDTEWGKYMLMAPWAKIHKSDFVKENQIWFNDSYGEDIAFIINEIYRGAKTKNIKYIGYNWYNNEESVSNTIYKGFRKEVNLIPMLDKIDSLAIKDDYFKYFVVKTCIYYLLSSGRTGSGLDFIAIHDELFGWIQSHHPDYLKNKYLHWGPRGEAFFTKTAVSVFMVFHKLKWMKLFARLYCKYQ